MVYFPAETPSKTSRSLWAIHWWVKWKKIKKNWLGSMEIAQSLKAWDWDLPSLGSRARKVWEKTRREFGKSCFSLMELALVDASKEDGEDECQTVGYSPRYRGFRRFLVLESFEKTWGEIGWEKGREEGGERPVYVSTRNHLTIPRVANNNRRSTKEFIISFFVRALYDTKETQSSHSWQLNSDVATKCFTFVLIRWHPPLPGISPLLRVSKSTR